MYRHCTTHNAASDEVPISASIFDSNIKLYRKLDYKPLQNVRSCKFEIGDKVVRICRKPNACDPFFVNKKL